MLFKAAFFFTKLVSTNDYIYHSVVPQAQWNLAQLSLLSVLTGNCTCYGETTKLLNYAVSSEWLLVKINRQWWNLKIWRAAIP